MTDKLVMQIERQHAKIESLRAERDELKARLDMLEGLRGDHYSDPRYFVDEELGAVCIESGGGDCFETLDECQIVNHLNEIVGDEKKEHARAESAEARNRELEGALALFRSMVDGGESQSDTSRRVYDAAMKGEK